MNHEGIYGYEYRERIALALECSYIVGLRMRARNPARLYKNGRFFLESFVSLRIIVSHHPSV